MSADATPSTVRRHVVYTGRVQGVGFRFTTVSVAERYAVSGWVRNRPDGTVELEAQGAPAEVERFLAEIDRVMGANIRERRVIETPASHDDAGFEIRY